MSATKTRAKPNGQQAGSNAPSKDDVAPAFKEPFDACSMLMALYQKAEPNLSPDELRWLEGSSDLAQYLASNSAKVADAIAEELTYEAAFDKGGIGTLGRKESIAGLFYTLGAAFTQIEGLILLSGWANYQRGVLLHGEEE
ncbi:MAG: hypothetical protein HEQ39_12425 [Rhizobacter sp.]